jgi:hypothetical protein
VFSWDSLIAREFLKKMIRLMPEEDSLKLQLIEDIKTLE